MRQTTLLLCGLAALSLALHGRAGAQAREQAARCPLQPPRAALVPPVSGFVWLPGEPFAGPCDAVPAGGWQHLTSGRRRLWVATDGPAGSGRLWTVTVAVGSVRDSAPSRGFCFRASTAGWRTLRRFEGGALPWLTDSDADGAAEVVIWTSFPLAQDGEAAAFGLAAWVYELAPAGSLRLAPAPTRALAGRLARAYREPLDADVVLAAQRAAAAHALDDVAAGRCPVVRRPAPDR